MDTSADRDAIHQQEFDEGARDTYSFAAAGWLQMYHFGVGKALQDLGIADSGDVCYAGSSAGSLASAALVSKCDFDGLRDYAIECCKECRAHPKNAFKIRQYVSVGIQRFAVDKFNEDAQIRADINNQLEVYMSVLPWCKAKCIDTFDDVEDLEEALLASCCITPLAGLPFQLRSTGEWVCDGGMTAFQPRKGEPGVVTVSPLYFTSALVKPSVFIPAWWGLYPPDEIKYAQLYDLGYNDALQYLIRSKRVDKTEIRKLRAMPIDEPRGWKALALDMSAGFFFVFILRPWALVLIYAEMLIVSALCLIVAALHDIVPVRWVKRADEALRTRKAAWADLYHSWRNLISARVALHMLLGKKVPINAKRLEKFSRLYRVFRPFL